MRGQPIDRDYFDTIMRQCAALERRLDQLENDSRPTYPFYNNTNWPTNVVEGQVVVAPRTTAVVGRPDDIVMVGYKDSDADWEDLYRMPTDAPSVPIRLTNVDQVEGQFEWYWAIWNGNAHTLIYAVVHTESYDRNEYWKINPDGTGATLIYSYFNAGSGALFAFLNVDTAGRPWGQGIKYPQDLEIVNLVTGAVDSTILPSVVSGYNEFAGYFLSNDGERLFLVLEDTTHALPYIGRIINRDGTGLTSTLLTQSEMTTFGVTWCPGDTKLIYRDSNTTLREMNDDGTGKTLIYTGAANSRLPLFSPDGTMCAFREGNDMKVLAAGTYTVLYTVSHGLGSANFEWDWSPDSTKMVIVKAGANATVDILTVATGTIVNLYNDTDPLVYLNVPRWGRHNIHA